MFVVSGDGKGSIAKEVRQANLEREGRRKTTSNQHPKLDSVVIANEKKGNGAPTSWLY